MKAIIEILKTDITKLQVDAIVNAANSSLLGGGGVDGAIHRAAGSELVHECRLLGGCKTGQAKVTKAYNLHAKWIIHTVGPVWREEQNREEEMLTSCYVNCWKIAAEKEIKSIAFPAISCGIYGYPADRAAKIAIKETLLFLAHNDVVEKVIFACFEENVYQAYLKEYASYADVLRKN